QAKERAFDTTIESETYLRPATESARRGYGVVVYGHTHLAKRVPLAGARASDNTVIKGDAVYLNSGTWADLMALPAGISAPDGVTDVERARLAAFADDLAMNSV